MSRSLSVTCLTLIIAVIAGVAFAERPLAEVRYLGSSVEFAPNLWGQGFVLKVMAPDGSVVEKIVKDGSPSFDLSESKSEAVSGRYKYEMRLIVSPPGKKETSRRPSSEARTAIGVPSLSGTFLVTGGRIVSPGSMAPEVGSDSMASPHGGPDAPDAFLPHDLCLGAFCTSADVFTADTTLKLKEESTGIRFEDSSQSGSGYPSNDWHIRANDTFEGGNDYFAVYDVDSERMPFLIEASATDNTLYVAKGGRLGINTSVPYQPLHIAHSEPNITMEKTAGTPQRWDLRVNDDAFFLYDVTNTRIPFVVEKAGAAAPIDGLTIKADGKVGLGTYYPNYKFEVLSSENTAVVVNRATGATNFINATASYGNFGTVSNHPLRLVVNSAWQMRINNDSSITMANGASLTAGGVWTDYSSRAAKKDIQSLSIEEAAAALSGLEPVKFAYKANGERHVGFIAEDVPELVASAGRNGLSPMDVVAVLTRVVKELQQLNEEQQEINNQLRERITVLEAR